MHFQVSGSRHHLIGPVYRFLRIHKKKTEITICKERRLIVKVILDYVALLKGSTSNMTFTLI